MNKQRPKPGVRYTFGRYKNQLVSEAPKTYARWCVRTFIHGLPAEPQLWAAIKKKADLRDHRSPAEKDERLTDAILAMMADSSIEF